MQSKTLWVTLTALLACAGSTFATTIHVPVDQPTIQTGINAAVDGDTVLVSPGTYTEHLDFHGKAVTVVGAAGPELTTVRGFVPNLAVVQFVSSEGLGTKITGLTITGGGPGLRSGIYCGFESSPTIEGNVIRGNLGIGVIVDDANAPVLKNNTIIGNGVGYDGGVLLNYATYTVAKNNDITNNNGIGIKKLGNSSVDLRYNDVFANTGGDYDAVAPGPGSISADPKFCDSSTHNYFLTSGSSCIGAGEAGVDIGAFGVGCVCNCDCHTDPSCDGRMDVLDVIGTIERAFRGGVATDDPSCTGHGSTIDGRTDVDCSGTTDVIDVIRMVNVAFRGQDPAIQFCKPCGM